MTNCFARATAALAVALSLAACGYGGSTGSTSRGRVFFVQPKDGATIKPLSTFQFGSEGVTVQAVPQGTITPEQVRAGTIHYHLGVDTDCLPAGTVIPKADPWVHFGDGKNVIEMSMTPGPHKVALQAGDDMHRTLEGQCQIINVTVAP